MKFKDAGIVSSVIWNMRVADLPRGQNRAAMDRLFNGHPPLTEEERIQSGAHVNVNFLDAPKIASDARRTFQQAFLKGSGFFNVTLDGAPPHKAQTWSRTITKSINRILKDSKCYFEVLRSQFAQTVLHGIGPVWWSDGERWCPVSIGVGDIMVPSGTLLTMENAVYFAVYRQWTAAELRRMVSGPNVDPGWNTDEVNKAIAWVDSQVKQGNYGTVSYMNDWLRPENMEERWKENGMYYGTDVVPTVDAWDFYYFTEIDGVSGWRRCVVLDTAMTNEAFSNRSTPLPERNVIGEKQGQWLYYSDKCYADVMDQIVHFQFGDASAVGPFRYHTVRSVGWLLYSVCHLQNRLRCKLSDAMFESTLQYFRATNPDDHERILKVDLHNYGVVPEGLNFITPAERWQVNAPLIELGLSLNRQSMNEAAAQYREGREGGASVEKTATQVIAEVNAANALVSGLLLQAYKYATYQYREIARRFCIKNSRDPDVRAWRLKMLKDGIDEEWLDSERWIVEPEQVMGAGNKILQTAMADKLMAARPLYAPEAQQEILRIYTEVNSDDPEVARLLVPSDDSAPSFATHDADQSVASLLMGLTVRPRPGENQIQVVEAWMAAMAARIQVLQASGADANDIVGLQNLANNIDQRIQLIAQSDEDVARAKQYANDLKQLLAIVQELAATVGQQQPQQANPQDAAKAQAMLMQAQVKAQISQANASQKLQQRDEAHQLKLAQSQENHDASMLSQMQQDAIDIASADLKTAADIRRQGAKSAVDQITSTE